MMAPPVCLFVNPERYQLGADEPNADSKSHLDFSGEEN